MRYKVVLESGYKNIVRHLVGFYFLKGVRRLLMVRPRLVAVDIMSNDVATAGKAVSITYSITTEDGAVVEQTDVPVTYIHGGKSAMFPEVEKALAGARVDDKVSVTIQPENAFGFPDESLMFTDDLVNVPEQFHRIGAEVQFQNESGESKNFRVTKIENGKLTVDANHPFAGKVITFHVRVASIRDATIEEIASGESMDSASPTLQ